MSIQLTPEEMLVLVERLYHRSGGEHAAGQLQNPGEWADTGNPDSSTNAVLPGVGQDSDGRT